MTRSLFLKVMSGFFLVSSLFPLFSAKKQKGNTDKDGIRTRQWNSANNVSKKYNTPLGTVYRLGETRDFQINKEITELHDPRKTPLNTLSVPLFKNRSEAKKLRRRFLVLEFSYRCYPAEQSSNVPEKWTPRFPMFGWSRNLTDIVSQMDLDAAYDQGTFQAINRMENPLSYTLNSSLRDINFNAPWFYYYEINHCRIILDQKDPAGFQSLNMNGYKHIFQWKALSDRPSNLPEINSFAIASSEKNVMWDISPLKIRHIEKESELKTLPELTQTPYPYHELLNAKKKYSKSPDYDYALAMSLLYGENPDWEKGFRLLTRTARKNHALALYQAGCALYRGIGCEIDYDAALKYCRKAAELQIPEARYLWGRILFLENYPYSYQENSKLPFRMKKTSGEYSFTRLSKIPMSSQQVEGTNLRMKLEWLRNLGAKELEPLRKQILDQLCRGNYAPALFLRGVSENFRSEAAQNDFRKGSKLGNAYCTLLFLQNRIINPLAKPQDITFKELMHSAQIPLIHLLHYGIRTQKLARIQEISQDLHQKINKMVPSSPEESFLKAASILHNVLFNPQETKSSWLFFTIKARQTPYALVFPVIPAQKQDLDNAFADLQKAADAGIPEAQYLLGRWLLNPRSPRHNPLKAKGYFDKAAAVYPPAAVKAAELALSARDFPKAENYLKLEPVHTIESIIIANKINPENTTSSLS